MKELKVELMITPKIHIKNKEFHLFLNRFSLVFENVKIIENNKNNAPIGNAEGRKNIPIRKNLLPIFNWLLNND